MISAEDIIESVQTIRSRIGNRPLLRCLAVDALRLAIILAIVEVLLQWAVPEYRMQRYDRWFTGSYPIAMNTDGYRGQIVSRQPTAGVRRVIALGDSVTLGVGQPWSSAWPAQLQQALIHSSGQPSEVINAGLPGASLREQIFAFQKKWASYKPDIVVFAISGNMIANAWDRRNDDLKMPRNPYMKVTAPQSLIARLKNRLIKWRHHWCLPSFVSVNISLALHQIGLRDHHLDTSTPLGPLLAYGYRQGDLPVNLAETAWSLFEAEVIELQNLVTRINAEFVVTYIPCRFVITDQWSDNLKAVPLERLTIDPMERSKLLCEHAGIPYVDSIKALRTERDKLAEAPARIKALYILGDYNHLNSAGHRAVANAISMKLRQIEGL